MPPTLGGLVYLLSTDRRTKSVTLPDIVEQADLGLSGQWCLVEAPYKSSLVACFCSDPPWPPICDSTAHHLRPTRNCFSCWQPRYTFDRSACGASCPSPLAARRVQYVRTKYEQAEIKTRSLCWLLRLEAEELLGTLSLPGPGWCLLVRRTGKPLIGNWVWRGWLGAFR